MGFVFPVQADSDHCPSDPFATYSGEIVDIFVCDNDDKRLIDRIARPGEGVRLFTVQRSDASALVVVNAFGNLAADSQSITVLIYDASTGVQLLEGHSKFPVAASDIDSDGSEELILYEDFLAFDSLLLADIGWPTIVELRDPISIGTLETYAALRARLLSSSKKTKKTLEAVCTSDGVFETLCGAAEDIRKLDLFIEILSAPR